MTKPSPIKRLVDVVIPLPPDTPFTYRCPREYLSAIRIGTRVLVPFGRRLLTGYVVGFPDAEPDQEVRDIRDILDREPLFSTADLLFYRWASQYYFHSIGLTIKAALPQGLAAEYQHTASCTPKGALLAGDENKNTDGTGILRELAVNGGSVAVNLLAKKVGRDGLAFLLRRLEAEGLVLLRLKKTRATVRSKKEKWYSCPSAESAPALQGKQKELLDVIGTQGCISLSMLKKRFGNCTRSLQCLVKKGLVSVEEREVFRRHPVDADMFTEPVRKLTPDQAHIIKQATGAITAHEFYPLLLHGVTGSGKTEVYLRIMEHVLQQGRQCLYLVPEIALTAQLWDRLRSRLNVPMTMLNSSLTNAERFDAWRLIRRGEIKAVIGARSAIFAPFPDLGAVIVDEEHDSSYKQEDNLRYNARDLALMRGKYAQAVVVLGSATPSLESYFNASRGKYFTGLLAERIEGRPLPRVSVVDMRRSSGPNKKNRGIISPELLSAISRNLSSGHQTLLFLNRRGYSPAFLCEQCGHAFKCPNCDVSLIHHRAHKRLSCHYCGLSRPVPQECPSCGSYFLKPLGWGTERLEKQIAKTFPEARVARMDRDTTAERGASRAILKNVYEGAVDILIGTQLIAKGYHLPRVTLVGVVCADHSLNFPDYRAGERTFQLLTQVAGRAGRGDLSGEVIVQTYNPEHYSISCACRHDYTQFYSTELQHRKDLGYPPYTRMVNFRFEGPDKSRVESLAEDVGLMARQLREQNTYKGTVTLRGPARAPWEKIKRRYRYQLLVRGAHLQKLRSFTTQLLQQSRSRVSGSDIRLIVDVDPQSTM